MLGFLKGDPKKKLQKEYEAKLAKALDAQRNGDLRTHGTLMEEAEKIYSEIQKLSSQEH
jgi:hypothetical protein